MNFRDGLTYPLGEIGKTVITHTATRQERSPRTVSVTAAANIPLQFDTDKDRENDYTKSKLREIFKELHSLYMHIFKILMHKLYRIKSIFLLILISN